MRSRGTIMRTIALILIAAGALSAQSTTTGQTTTAAQQQVSLGDAARRARESKPAEPQAKVFTNENLPTGGTISVLGDNPSPPVTSSADGSASAGSSVDPNAKKAA